MDFARAGAERLIRFGRFGRLGRGDCRTAGDRRGQLRDLRAAAAADGLQLLQILLGPRGRAHLDHCLALDRDRVRVVGLEQQRLVGHADRLAEQMLLFGDARDVDERATVARIDCQRRFEQVFGRFELARCDLFLGLTLQLDRFRRNLVIGALARDRGRECKSGYSDEQKPRQGPHQSLHLSPPPNLVDAAARRKSRRSGRERA